MKFKKVVSLFLAVSMITSSLPAVVSAENEINGGISLIENLSDISDDIASGTGADIENNNEYEDGEYYADLELDYIERSKEGSAYFEKYFLPTLSKVIINTDEEGNKSYKLLMAMDWKNSSYYRVLIKTLGYSKEKYTTDNGVDWDSISTQPDYVDLRNAVDESMLYQISDTSSAYCYEYELELNSLTDDVYVYFTYNKYQERVAININNITESKIQIEHSAPVITNINNYGTALNGLYYHHQKINIQPSCKVDGTPSKYILEYTIDDKIFDKKQDTNICIIGRTGYDRLNDSQRETVDYIEENSEAHTIKVRERVGVIYSDSDTEYWSEWAEIEIPMGKAGISQVNSEEVLSDYTYSYPPHFYTSDCVIPYDSTLSISNVADDEKSKIEVLLKEITGRNSIDFSALDVRLLDKYGNIQEEFIPVGSKTSWAEQDVLSFTFPSIKNFDVTNMSVYKYENGTLTKQNVVEFTVSDTDTATNRGTFAFRTENEASGIYVFTQGEYSDMAEGTQGWANYETHIVENSDHLNNNEYTGAILNEHSYIYADSSLYAYVMLQPVNGKYIDNIYYSRENGFEKAEILENYNINGNIYPKTIRIPLESRSAYVPIRFSVDDTEVNASLAINFNNPARMTSKPKFDSPVITVKNNVGNEVSNLTNDGTAIVSLSAAAAGSENIIYTVTNSAGESIYTNAVYSEPFELTANNEEGEKYTVTAYVQTSDTSENALDSSESVTKTISFSKKGAYAETVDTPAIGTQYLSGDSLENSKFKVVISTTTEGADIYYTTDGSEPTENSEKYTGVFTVDGTTNGQATVIKAVAVKAETNNSEIAEKTIVFTTNWWDNILPNEQYSVPVKMVKYGEAETLSMGNDAIAGNATLTTDSNGNKFITIPFKSIPIGTMLGNIIHFWYFPDETQYYSDNWLNYMLDYEAEYVYNTSTGLITSVTLPVYNDDGLIPAALESDFAVMGKQRTYIKPDYSNVIEDITGVKQDNDDVDLPVISPVLSYDGTSASVTIYMDSASDYKDADIYYIISKDENTEWNDNDKIKYNTGDIIEITADDVDEDGFVNVFAVAEYEGKSSMVNVKKIVLDLSATTVTETTTESTTESTSETTTENTTETTTETTTESTTESTTEPVEVNKYCVNVDLWNANVNQASMGDRAFEENPKALVTVSGGKIKVQIATNPVSIEPFYSALQNMMFVNTSGQWQYVTPVIKNTIAAFDGADSHELEYLQVFEIELANTTDEYVNVAINVPYTPMDGISENTGGYINARLKFDWSSKEDAADDAVLIPAEKSTENSSESTTEGTTESTTEETTESTTESATESTTENTTEAPVNVVRYSVPVKMVQAANPNVESMGNAAIDGDAIVTVKDGKATVDLSFKAVTYSGLYGHLLKLWGYPVADTMDYSWWNDSTKEIPAEVVDTYMDYGMNYTTGDTTQSEFVKTIRLTRDAEKENIIYIRISVDAMAGFDQPARLDFDWDNAQVLTYVEPSTDESSKETETATENTTESATDESSIESTTEVSSESSTEASTGSNGGSSSDDSSNTVEDGSYWMEINLWNANIDQASMGNAAFENNRKALVTISGNTARIEIASNPVAVSGYTSALQDIRSNSVDINVDSRESFTTNTRYDGTEHTFDYITKFSFDLNDITTEYIPVEISVPYTPMDGISANVGGYISARLKLDWSSLEMADTGATLNPDSTSATGSSSSGGGGGSVNTSSAETGIKIEADEFVFPDDTTFTYNAVTTGTEYETAKELIADDFRLFSISAQKDGENVLPSGIAKIYFPVEEGDENVAIYRIIEGDKNTEAGKTELEYEFSEDGKYYVVTVKEFGLFAVANSSETEDDVIEAVKEEQVVTSDGTIISFDDINDHWAKDYILKATELGLFNGISEDKFAPDMDTTRAMFVTVLGRLNGVSENKEGNITFEDVNKDDYFYPFVVWASENNIVEGFNENTFAPELNITREQMARILYEFAKSEGIELKMIARTEFTDAESISSWAEEGVNALSKAGIINGRTDGTFDPKGNATRAEIATMLVNFINEYMA